MGVSIQLYREGAKKDTKKYPQISQMTQIQNGSYQTCL